MTMTPNEEFAGNLIAAAQKFNDESPTCIPIARPKVVFGKHLGWSFGLNTHAHPGTGEAKIWHYQLSAKLIGDSSDEDDWRDLGGIVAAVQTATGCPVGLAPAAPILPIEESHPKSTMIWLWHGDGSPVDEAVVGGTKLALAMAQANERETAVQSRPVARDPYPPLEKVGRNEICPCGSGKKFKKCHGGAN